MGRYRFQVAAVNNHSAMGGFSNEETVDITEEDCSSKCTNDRIASCVTSVCDHVLHTPYSPHMEYSCV